MRITLAISFLTLLGSSGGLELPSRLPKIGSNLIETCKQKTGATASDFESIRARKFPRTKSGRCLIDCILGGIRIIEDNRYSKKGTMMVLSGTAMGDVSKLSKLRELAELCEREIGGVEFQNCVGGEKVLTCLARNGKKLGLAPTASNK